MTHISKHLLLAQVPLGQLELAAGTLVVLTWACLDFWSVPCVSRCPWVSGFPRYIHLRADRYPRGPDHTCKRSQALARVLSSNTLAKGSHGRVRSPGHLRLHTARAELHGIAVGLTNRNRPSTCWSVKSKGKRPQLIFHLSPRASIPFQVHHGILLQTRHVAVISKSEDCRGQGEGPL